MKKIFGLVLLALTMSLTAQENGGRLSPIEYELSPIVDDDGGEFVYGSYYQSANCTFEFQGHSETIPIDIFYSILEREGIEYGYWTFYSRDYVELNLIQGEVLFDAEQNPVINCVSTSDEEGKIYIEQGAWEKISALTYEDPTYTIIIEDMVFVKKYKAKESELYFRTLNITAN